MKKIKIEVIELKGSKLLGNLNIEKGIQIEAIKEIEMELEKLKIPKTRVNTIKNLIISEKYLGRILRQRKYCA